MLTSTSWTFSRQPMGSKQPSGPWTVLVSITRSETRFIWCHAGISRRIRIPTISDDLRRLLGEYDNLWVDLSWVVSEAYVAPGGKPNPAWIELIEAYPDRFMIGSDTVGRFAKLPDEIHKYYVLLDALEPATSRKVARDNFLSVLPSRIRQKLTEDRPKAIAGEQAP